MVDGRSGTDLIASACVIAQLELVKHAAPMFGWTLDTETIDALLTEARELNEVSAQPERTGPSMTDAVDS